MQNARFNYNNPMNFQYNPEMAEFRSPNPPIYSFQPQFGQQSHNPPPSPHPPYSHGGCSDYEQRLCDEVIYLHSLWRRGPPPRNPHFLKPSHTTRFKKKPKVDSGKEWPVHPRPPKSSPPRQGWGSFGSKSTPKFRPPSAQEQDRVLAVRVHLRGLDSSMGFFCNSDGEDVVVNDDDEEDEYDEEEAFEMFVNVFEEDEGLRSYYKTRFHNGEFYCLVCGVIGHKLGRKYGDCIALVQHSNSISKAKKRIAHRAYARVVCKILGWDIDCLPSLPLTVVNSNLVAENQSLDLEKSSDPPQGENKNNVNASEDNDNQAVIDGEEDPAHTKDSQAEPESFPEAAEDEYVSILDNRCSANEHRDDGDNLASSQSMSETGTSTIVRETQ